MGGNRRTNKARNQIIGSVGARWFTNGKKRNRKRDKIAKASRKRNR